MLQYIDDQIIMTKEDGSEELLRKPECFTYHDKIDPSCFKCKVKQVCIEVQAQNLPPCYGLYHAEDVPECRACILESQCAEAQYLKENGKMPTIVVRKPATAVKPAQAIAEETVAEVVKPTPKLTVKKVVAKPAVPVVAEVEDAQPDLPDAYGLTDWPIEALRELAARHDVAADGRKSILVQRLLRSEGAVAEVSTKAEVQPDAAAYVEAGLTTSPDVLMELSMRLQEGQSLLLTPTDDGAVIVKAIGVAAAVMPELTPSGAKRALRGDAYDKEVWTPEYYSFVKVDAGDGKSWASHTAEEKLEAAKAAGVTWEEHADAKINTMRMFDAVTAALGLEKYKPEYKTKASRDALK